MSKKEVEAWKDNQASHSSKVDIPEIMAKIRERVKQDVEANRDAKRPFKPFQADTDKTCRAGQLLYSEELRYLNSNYAFGPNLDLDSISSHRPGPIGKVIVKLKQKILTIIWDLLKGYFTAEREFNANLVRYLNDTAKYVDQRDAANFWELITKIDYDLSKALERIERQSDEQMAALRSSERRLFDELDKTGQEINQVLGELRATAVQQADKLQTLESVSQGLETIIARLKSKVPKQTAKPKSDPESLESSMPDYSYLLLENRYRGSEAVIQERLSIYPPLFKDAPGPVLELGPGRGELLELFDKQQIKAYGVELDSAMVECCLGKDLEVEVGDAIGYMRQLDDDSLGGVVAVQVVEHLSQSQLRELFELCTTKVKSGGKIAFETINPRSLLALSSNYFRDPTHVWPLHPDTLEYAMSLAGLKVIDLKKLSPVAQEAQLRKLPVEGFMTPRWVFALEALNRNFQQLNELIYGHQDYCIVAEVV